MVRTLRSSRRAGESGGWICSAASSRAHLLLRGEWQLPGVEPLRDSGEPPSEPDRVTHLVGSTRDWGRLLCGCNLVTPPGNQGELENTNRILSRWEKPAYSPNLHVRFDEDCAADSGYPD